MIDVAVSTSLPKSLYVLMLEIYIFCILLVGWVVLVSWNAFTPIAPLTFLLLCLFDAIAASCTIIVMIWYSHATQKMTALHGIFVTSIQLTVCVLVSFFLCMISSAMLPASSRYWLPNVLYEPAFEFLQPEWLLQLQSVGMTAFVAIYCTGLLVLVIVLRAYVRSDSIQTPAPAFRVFYLFLLLLQSQLVNVLQRMCVQISDCQFGSNDLPLQSSYESVWEIVIIPLSVLFLEILYFQTLSSQTPSWRSFLPHAESLPAWVIQAGNRGFLLVVFFCLLLVYDSGTLPYMSTFIMISYLGAAIATAVELAFHLLGKKPHQNKSAPGSRPFRIQSKKTPLLRLMTMPTKKEL